MTIASSRSPNVVVPALIAAAVGGALWAILTPGHSGVLLQSYLAAWLFVLGVVLGSLALLWLHNLTGGAWGREIRPYAAATATLLPLVAAAFVPIALNLRWVYPWATPEALSSADPILVHKRPWLNIEAFQIRAAVYFAVWIIMGLLVAQAERRAAREGTEAAARRVRVRSGQALGLYGLSMTFASIDWAMSLDPHWYSAAYGVIFVIGQVLSALVWNTLIAAGVERRAAAAHPASPAHDHGEPHESSHHATPLQDLGNLMLGFTMLWAYTAFSQFLIIWFGDLPEEVVWYVRRFHGGWEVAALALVVFHFGLPFFALMSRHNKRDPRIVGGIATGLLAMRFVDVAWQVAPEFGPVEKWTLPSYVGAALFVGGLSTAAFGIAVRSRRDVGGSAP